MAKTKTKTGGVGVVGQNVKRLRLAKGWTQDDLGRRSKMNRTTVISVERGEFPPRTSTLQALAKALSCDVAALFFEPPPEPSPSTP